MVTLESKYLKLHLCLMMGKEKAMRLFKCLSPLYEMENDIRRMDDKEEPIYFSVSQLKKIKSYLIGSGDYWAKIR